MHVLPASLVVLLGPYALAGMGFGPSSCLLR